MGDSELGDETSFKVDLYSWSHIGRRQAEDYKGDLSRLILNSFKGKALGLYILDKDYQQFGNAFDAARRPFLYSGAGAEPPVDGTYGGRTLQGGTYFKTDEFNLDYAGDYQDNIPVFSVYLKLRFFALPTTGEEIIMKLISDKNLYLTVSSTGALSIVSNGNTLHTYTIETITPHVSTPEWYHLVVTIGSVNLTPSNFESYCMIELQTTSNKYDSEGNSFTCKANFSNPLGNSLENNALGIPSLWSFTLGDPSNSGILNFQAALAIISKGPMPFKYDNLLSSCHGTVSGTTPDRCNIEIVQGARPLCVDCSENISIKWYQDEDNLNSLWCAQPDEENNPDAEYSARGVSSHFFSGTLRVACDIGFDDDNSCAACHPSCATCDGSNYDDCGSCKQRN